MLYEIEQYGSCTTILRRFIKVEANSKEEAITLLNEKGYYDFEYTENFEIDDDYSEFNNIKKLKEQK